MITVAISRGRNHWGYCDECDGQPRPMWKSLKSLDCAEARKDALGSMGRRGTFEEFLCDAEEAHVCKKKSSIFESVILLVQLYLVGIEQQ